MKHLLALPFLFVVFNATSQTISTEAPSVSASATTVPKNTLQIESGMSVSSNNYWTTVSLPYTLFRLGLSDRWELRINNSFNVRKYNGSVFSNPSTNYGFGSFQVGTKFQFIKNPESKTKIAAIANVTIPSYNSNSRAASLNFSFSHQLSSKHSLGYNLGYSPSYSVSISSPDIISNINYSLIYGYSLNSKLSIFGEFFGNYNYHTAVFDPTTSLSVDFGIMYLLRDNIQIDYAYGRGFTDDFDFHSLGFNILLNSKKK
ncbi:MAG: hypothetical protein ACJA1C_001387 [Crocinitomicaceae bacterium]|jgi:hypothetical protein